MNCVIKGQFNKGIIGKVFEGIIRKMTIKWSFSLYSISFIKFHGKTI